jgi:hypothetical protein
MESGRGGSNLVRDVVGGRPPSNEYAARLSYHSFFIFHFSLEGIIALAGARTMTNDKAKMKNEKSDNHTFLMNVAPVPFLGQRDPRSEQPRGLSLFPCRSNARVFSSSRSRLAGTAVVLCFAEAFLLTYTCPFREGEN